MAWMSKAFKKFFPTVGSIAEAELTNSDANLDKAIMSAAEKMKGDRTKNRVTVYYLLAAHFGKLSMFS